MAQKTGQIQTPAQRMSGNTQKESIAMNYSGGMNMNKERADLSQMANDALFKNVNIQKSDRNQ